MPKTRRKTPPITLAGNRHAVRDTLATLRNRGAVSSEMPTPERILQARGAVEIGKAETVVDASRKDGVISQPRVRLSDDPWARIKASPKLHADPDMRRLLGEAGDRFAMDHHIAFGSYVTGMDLTKQGGGDGSDGWFATDHQVAAMQRWKKADAAVKELGLEARIVVDGVCIGGASFIDLGRKIAPSIRNRPQLDAVVRTTLYLGLFRLAKHYGLTGVTGNGRK